MKKSKQLLWELLILSLAFSISCAPQKTKKENCRKYFDRAQELSDFGELKGQEGSDSAEVYLEKAIACSTEFVDAYLALGKYFTSTGQNSLAEVTYEQLIENNPGNKDGYRALAFLSEEMGDFVRAESLYETAHSIDTENKTIMYALARTYLKNEKCEQAIPLFEKVEKDFPEDREVTLSLADAYYDCKDFSKALGKYLLLKSDLPDISSFYLRAGKCYEGLKQHDNAAAYLDTALAKSDNKLPVYYHIINMYIAAQDYQKAQGFAKKALRLAPNDSGICNLMGDTYIGFGDLARAREEFNHAVANYQNAKTWFKKASFSGESGIDRANQKIKNILKTAGIIKGKITDATNGEPLPFSKIIVVGAKHKTVSDLSGDYYIILSQGIYDIKVRMMGYETSTARNVKAKAGETTIVDFNLDLEKY